MSEDNLQAWKAIEDTSEHQPQEMRGGVDRPLPDGLEKLVATFQHMGLTERVARVEIKRDVQRLHPLSKWIMARIVEIHALGLAVDHRSDETEIANATLELVGRGRRALHCEMSKARVAIGATLDFGRQKVIGFTRQLDREARIRFGLNAWTGHG